MRREHHDDNLLIFCTAGRGVLQLAGEVHLVQAGDLILIPPGTAHEYRSLRRAPWTLYWAHFAGEDAPALATYLRGGGGPVLHCGVAPGLVADFENLLEAATGAYRLEAYINASNRLRQLLTEFALYRDQPRDRRLGAADLDSLQHFMRQRLGSSLQLAELARLAGLSPQHFAQRYREHTGTPPLTHFRQMKIEAACHLLDSTEDSVKSIAAQLGFSDPLYFSRVFRRTQGMSPSGYRSSQRR
jgi:AraC-like DNA-binding protein